MPSRGLCQLSWNRLNNIITRELKDIEFDYMSLDIMKECMMQEYKGNLGQFFEINYIIN